MKIKFQKGLNEYTHLVMFDLAKKVSGVCVWDLKEQRPVFTEVLQVSDSVELPVMALFEELDGFFSRVEQRGIDLKDVIVYKEAMPPQIQGGNSTVQTFISLARSHATLDLYTSLKGLAMYDYIGVFPMSTHAYLRKLLGYERTEKITKEQICSYVEEKYGLESLSHDESDAAFLAETFVNIKWNKDLQEEIKNIKKHVKELVDPKRIATLIAEQQRLEGLKVEVKGVK